jgi:hypothetical protein
MRDVVEERDSRFVLPLEGMRAEDLLDDCWLVVRDGEYEARIGVTQELEELAKSVVADRAVVLAAAVSAAGRLEVTFSGGCVLAISPLEDVEAWEVRGPGDVNVVCLPGGGEPAIWDATSESRTIRPGDPLPPGIADAIESFGLPMPTGEFEFRRTKGRRKSFALGPPRNKEED